MRKLIDRKSAHFDCLGNKNRLDEKAEASRMECFPLLSIFMWKSPSRSFLCTRKFHLNKFSIKRRKTFFVFIVQGILKGSRGEAFGIVIGRMWGESRELFCIVTWEHEEDKKYKICWWNLWLMRSVVRDVKWIIRDKKISCATKCFKRKTRKFYSRLWLLRMWTVFHVFTLNRKKVFLLFNPPPNRQPRQRAPDKKLVCVIRETFRLEWNFQFVKYPRIGFCSSKIQFLFINQSLFSPVAHKASHFNHPRLLLPSTGIFANNRWFSSFALLIFEERSFSRIYWISPKREKHKKNFVGGSFASFETLVMNAWEQNEKNCKTKNLS